MSDGKYDRVRQVDFVGVLVDGSRDNRWVDDDRVIGGHGFATQLHAGILRRKVDADVFVQDERYPDLTCKRTVGGGGDCSVFYKWHLSKENATLPGACGHPDAARLFRLIPKVLATQDVQNDI